MDLLQREHSKILTQSDPPPVKLCVADIRWQIAVEWLAIVQWSQWSAYRKSSLFGMARPPFNLPFPRNGSQMHTLLYVKF